MTGPIIHLERRLSFKTSVLKVAVVMANATTISKGNSGIVGVGFRLGVELGLGDEVGEEAAAS